MFICSHLQPDIFCLHNRWNTNEVKKLYAPEIPIYFTILRDPVDVFISAWDYVEASRLFFNGQSLENFVMSDKPKPDQQIGQIHLNNSMMYDFGFTSEQSENTSAIEQKIKGNYIPTFLSIKKNLVPLYIKLFSTLKFLREKLIYKI